MKMISAGAGLGVGVKNYRVIFVFENNDALNHFLDSGWSGSAQTGAAAKAPRQAIKEELSRERMRLAQALT